MVPFVLNQYHFWQIAEEFPSFFLEISGLEVKALTTKPRLYSSLQALHIGFTISNK